MTLNEYFNKPQVRSTKESATGTQSEWMDFCTLALRGPKFLIVDASFMPSEEDGLVVEASPGEYQLQAKVITYGSDQRISRLRAFRKDSSGTLGKKLGETWTDTAQTGVCDLEVFAKAWGSDNDASYARIEDSLHQAEHCGIAVLDKAAGAVAPFVSSGFGDGSFPVCELVENGKRVGFEVEFIAENAPYPFGKKSSQGNDVTTAKSVSPDAHANLLTDLFNQLGKALRGDGTGSKPASKEEKKAKMAEVFKQLEEQMHAETKGATAEFRQHLKEVRLKASSPWLKFKPAQDESFMATPQAQSRKEELIKAGFVPAGLFETDGVAKSKMAGFFHPDLRVYAVLNFNKEGINCDLTVDYPDGTTLIVTDNTRYGWMVQPLWRTMLRKATNSIQELLQLLLAEAPQKQRPPVSAEDFIRGLNPDAARYLYWLNDRGGFNKEELRALYLQRNPTKQIDDESLKMLRVETADKALFNWLRLQQKLPFQPEGVMGSLIIIHDELTPDLLVNAFWCGTNDFKAREHEFAEGKPRAAFARVNAERGNKLRKVVEKTTGLAADYYLPPV